VNEYEINFCVFALNFSAQSFCRHFFQNCCFCMNVNLKAVIAASVLGIGGYILYKQLSQSETSNSDQNPTSSENQNNQQPETTKGSTSSPKTSISTSSSSINSNSITLKNETKMENQNPQQQLPPSNQAIRSNIQLIIYLFLFL
jgi:hypothetical protein